MSTKIEWAELKAILYQHKLWLENKGGKRANLREANLCGAPLRRADLCEGRKIASRFNSERI